MNEFRTVEPAIGPIDASVRPPGSKSHTIRALVVSALAEGDSLLRAPLDADDTRAARRALGLFGVDIAAYSDPWRVIGSGGSLEAAAVPVDVGASGLTARSVIALASLIHGTTTVVGRDRLPQRPMGGLVDALKALGVATTSVGGHLPVTVDGGALPGGLVTVASHQTSQFASAVLLVAPLALDGMIVVPEGLVGSRRYLEVTIAMMKEFGAIVEQVESGYRVEPGGYRGSDITIEPDASAAVYPMVAAAITGGRVTIEGLGAESLQPDLAVAGVLEQMGCVVRQTGSETTVEAATDGLRPIDIDLSGSPDGSLAVAVAALFADGPSRLRGLGSLRHKESDRLAALTAEITRLGAGATVEGDDLTIVPGVLHPARVQSYGDHRVAMSFGLVGLCVPGIEIADPDVVAKTWPSFWDMLSN
ncbi:MAG: 3-phosphoshikimate 1-carboxyvinyltransferase, partial [Acidimicrobiia bacterium]